MAEQGGAGRGPQAGAPAHGQALSRPLAAPGGGGRQPGGGRAAVLEVRWGEVLQALGVPGDIGCYGCEHHGYNPSNRSSHRSTIVIQGTVIESALYLVLTDGRATLF